MLRKLYYEIVTKMLQKCYENFDLLDLPRLPRHVQILLTTSSATAGGVGELEAGSCYASWKLQAAYEAAATMTSKLKKLLCKLQAATIDVIIISPS